MRITDSLTISIISADVSHLNMCCMHQNPFQRITCDDAKQINEVDRSFSFIRLQYDNAIPNPSSMNLKSLPTTNKQRNFLNECCKVRLDKN